VGETHVHLYGDDYLVERAGDLWSASVPCFCGIGAPPTGPLDWHWHDVVWAETFDALLVQLAARQIINEAEAA
jgi:hypothetical protein